VGFAASQDTYKVTEPDPTGHSYGKAIANALRDAKASAADVGLIAPNGLGIPSFDRAELKGLRSAFGDQLSAIPMSPIKAQIGNLAAGNGVDVAATVLALHSGKIPPGVNTRKPIDGAKLNVAPEARDAEIKIAITSVYSLGGQNAALVFRRV
jgi:3-oxoacyl-[acyl-carrier-protein] synthase II